ncbi:polygalacturonase [Fusarium oxysporum f. sp. raphani 54005]|uniref:Polygalacturonase n=1 Tax=Fusarium oxysporum f. sp. raphani 54005 TaxID=1089458 RepID=X0B7L6_FUSOX|nr:polygalacturonase [Fusarium oxysporum f. sp. raphani 54005]
MIKFGSALFLTALANNAMAAPSDPEVHIYNDKCGSCTFSDASKAMAGQSNCTNLILNNVAVPAGTTLDLTKLQDGAKVTFQGTTTWDYKEWEGPLLSIAGNKITVEGASGAILNADGARWWDGKGDKGKTKPKFFAAHKLTNSNITNLYIKNTPVQAVSVNGVNGLNIDKMTIDNADGDSKGGHNTDGFDIGGQGSNPYHEIHIWIHIMDPYPFHSIPRGLQHFHIHATKPLPYVPHVEIVEYFRWGSKIP